MSQSTSTSSESPPREDFPGNLFARVARSTGAIKIGPICGNGDLQFSLPLPEMGMRHADLDRTTIPRTPFFVDWAGEILVRKNIGAFAALLVGLDLRKYDQVVNQFECLHFGMIVDEKSVAHFTFHGSLVQRILTEDLDAVLLPWLA